MRRVVVAFSLCVLLCLALSAAGEEPSSEHEGPSAENGTDSSSNNGEHDEGEGEGEDEGEAEEEEGEECDEEHMLVRI